MAEQADDQNRLKAQEKVCQTSDNEKECKENVLCQLYSIDPVGYYTKKDNADDDATLRKEASQYDQFINRSVCHAKTFCGAAPSKAATPQSISASWTI